MRVMCPAREKCVQESGGGGALAGHKALHTCTSWYAHAAMFGGWHRLHTRYQRAFPRRAPGAHLAGRATFLLTIPTSAQDLPSDGEGPPNRP